MGPFLSGIVVLMSLGWPGPDLETELAAFDTSLTHVKELPNIESLRFHLITTPKVTTAGLLQLRKLTAVKFLRLPGKQSDEAPRVP